MTQTAQRWTARPAHRRWLNAEASALLRFHEAAAIDPEGGFYTLDQQGKPDGNALREVHATARMVHCYAIAALMGRPGALRIVDHGMRFLWDRHRQPGGGYAWGVTAKGVPDGRRTGYGHAFVLLAASSAKMAGHPDADRMIADVTQVLRRTFWEEDHGAITEEFDADWQPIDPGYRGQNCNMHLTEALMAAFEATGDATHLLMAERNAALIVNRRARESGWRLAEHFDADWQVRHDYVGDPMFRPAGLTPGHALEWARLLVQLYETGGRRLAWAPEAACALFRRAVQDGWDPARGGFYYTLGWDDAPDIADRYWWPVCEGIGAAHALSELTGDPEFETWYRVIWDVAALDFIDHAHGGWHPQLDAAGAPASDPFFGKPDIYHALQACLIPLYPVTGSLTAHLREGE